MAVSKISPFEKVQCTMTRQRPPAERTRAERFASTVTLRQIRYFIAVAETGKITSAANMVGISPSAITEAVAELEALSGTALFIRHARGLELTFEGHSFLSRARNILSAVDRAGAAIIRADNDLRGKITLGATITITGYFITPLITRFQMAFPNIEIEVVERRRPEIEAGLLSGEIDLAIMLSSNLSERKLLLSYTLVNSMRRLWLPSDHPLLRKGVVTLKDVASLPYIQLLIDDAETSTATYWHRHKLSPRIVFRTESVEAVRSLIAHGGGVTILSDMMYRPWSLEGDRIEVLEILANIPMMTTGIVWARHRTLTEGAQTFLNFCKLDGEISRTQTSRAMPTSPTS